MPHPWATRQRELFEKPSDAPAVWLPLEVQEELRRALVQWMQALAKVIRKENCDEQDHR